ncbi:MAG TPA: lipoyl synthase [Actinomycetota bacterium]|nr:lipoyl synthase [Actinomycetota bacterium]
MSSTIFLGASIPTRAALGDDVPRRPPRPPWVRNRLRTGPNYTELKGLVRGLELHTVCEEASCPNVYECWEAKEATFLILGKTCTRRCGFCDIATGKPGPLDPEEPVRVASAVAAMGLRFAVVTGVERDDHPPMAQAQLWAATIRAIRAAVPGCRVEVLTGDLKGDPGAIGEVLAAGPDVFAHNLETTRRLHRSVRPGFRYDRSLAVLRMAKEVAPRTPTKSNLIVGMGETSEEVVATLGDLREAGVDIMTIGQYLAPSVDHHLPVHRWVHPDEFAEYRRIGEELGFAWVEAGPLVRSSYHAGKQYRAAAARLAAAL